MYKVIYLFFFLTSLSLSAQLKVRGSLDFGLSTSGLKQTTVKDIPQWETKYISETKPLIAPIFGLNALLDYKGWFTEIGIQHSKIGNVHNYNKIEYGPIKTNTRQIDNFETSFTRLSLPVNVGYAFGIWNELKLSINVGRKFNYFTSAKLGNTNPLSKIDYNVPMEKRNTSTIMGVGFQYKRVGINVNYSINQAISYGKTYPDQWEGFFGYWKKNDLSVTAKYFIF